VVTRDVQSLLVERGPRFQPSMSKSNISPQLLSELKALREMYSSLKNTSSSKSQKKSMSKGKTDSGGDGLSVSSVPASVSYRLEKRGPRIQYGSGSKSMRIANSELVLASIPGSTGFTVQSSIPLQPALSSTFAWLGPQAAKYQQYKVHKLRARYIPIAPTSTQGDIMLVPDYDASDPPPTTEVQASDNIDRVEDSCWRSIECKLDPTRMMGGMTRKFIRPCAVAGDPKTFDLGKLFVISNNQTGTSSVGKLFLDYDFEFFDPQNSPDPSTTPQQTSFFTQHASQTFTNGTPAAMHWDTLVYDPLNLGSPTNGVFTPPAGCYRIDSQMTFSDGSNESFTATVRLYKNGAALTDAVNAITFSPSGGSNITASLIGIIPMNGTDTFQIEVTLNGAAGALTGGSDNAQLIVSLA